MMVFFFRRGKRKAAIIFSIYLSHLTPGRFIELLNIITLLRVEPCGPISGVS